MLFKPLVFAAATAAFLIVPEVSSNDEGIFRALPIEAQPFAIPTEAFGRNVNVPCPGCKGKDSQLQLGFDVEDDTRLTLNGFELYPSADPWHGGLSANVAKSNGKSKQQKLGYSLAIQPGATDVDQGVGIVRITLRIIQVGDRFVSDVPTVQVKLIKTNNGEVMIGSIDLQEATEVEIDSFWSRLKNIFTGKWTGGKKGCGRPQNQNQNQDVQESTESTHVNDGDNHRPSHEHTHHHGGHRRHHWQKLIKNIAACILLPVLIGITAGVGVALIAMVLCTTVTSLAALMKCPRSNPSTHKADEVAADEEKAGLMVAEDELPAYEDEPTKN